MFNIKSIDVWTITNNKSSYRDYYNVFRKYHAFLDSHTLFCDFLAIFSPYIDYFDAHSIINAHEMQIKLLFSVYIWTKLS